MTSKMGVGSKKNSVFPGKKRNHIGFKKNPTICFILPDRTLLVMRRTPKDFGGRPDCNQDASLGPCPGTPQDLAPERAAGPSRRTPRTTPGESTHGPLILGLSVCDGNQTIQTFDKQIEPNADIFSREEKNVEWNQLKGGEG